MHVCWSLTPTDIVFCFPGKGKATISKNCRYFAGFLQKATKKFAKFSRKYEKGYCFSQKNENKREFSLFL
jgi:hypothetical protein